MAEIATAVSDSEIAAEKADDTSEKSKSPPTDDTVVHVKDLPITVYISSVSLDSELKIKQRRVMDALNSKNIAFTCIDIANNKLARRRMRHMCDDPTALPPRIFKGSQYLGDFLDFQQAMDDGKINAFLHII